MYASIGYIVSVTKINKFHFYQMVYIFTFVVLVCFNVLILMVYI